MVQAGNKAFGQRLRELRLEKKMLQNIFAEQCGISSAYLSDIERGKRNPPAREVILEWAKLLDEDLAEEIGRELIDLSAVDKGLLEEAEPGREPVMETEIVVKQGGYSSKRTVVSSGEKGRAGKKARFLDHFGRDLVAGVGSDRMPGRVWEFDEIACVTACKMRNSAVITSNNSAEGYEIVQALAGEIADQRAPGHLSQTRLLALDGSIAMGTKYRGQFEERLKMVIEETQAHPEILLYVHSLADLVDWEANARGSFFRPALQAGTVRVITSATQSEMAYCRKINAALVDCFREVPILPLDREGVLRGLYALRDVYGAYHGVSYSEGALVAIVDAVEAGDDSGFWKRALALFDEVGARAKLAGETDAVQVNDVDRITER